MAGELFFGDRERAGDARAEVARLVARLEEARGAPAGALRHSALAACLVLAGELAAGVAGRERRAAVTAPVTLWRPPPAPRSSEPA